MKYKLEAEFELRYANDYQFATDRIRAALKLVEERTANLIFDEVHFRKLEERVSHTEKRNDNDSGLAK
jgi:hypothetical protein